MSAVQPGALAPRRAGPAADPAAVPPPPAGGDDADAAGLPPAIAAALASQDARRRMIAARHALVEAIGEAWAHDPLGTLDVLTGALEILGTTSRPPLPEMERGWLAVVGRDFMDDCTWWADRASAAEAEAMLVALTRVLEHHPPVAPVARKRLLAALWQTLDAPDRRAFLRRADPRGRLVREIGA